MPSLAKATLEYMIYMEWPRGQMAILIKEDAIAGTKQGVVGI